MQRVEKPDAEALTYHLHDIVEEDTGETKLWSSGTCHFAKLPAGTPTYSLFATSPPGSKQRGRPNEPDFVGILLLLVRLEAKATDIVIAVNVPHISGQYNTNEVDPESGKQGLLLERASEYRQKIMETFEIQDWNLFVQD